MDNLFGKKATARAQMETIMARELLKYPDLDLQADAKFLAKAIAKSTASSQSSVLTNKMTTLLLNKGINTFFHYFDEDYSRGFAGFRWCLQLIYYVQRFNVAHLVDQDFFEDCERLFSLLCAKCLILDVRTKMDSWSTYQPVCSKLDEQSILQGLLFNIMECTDPSTMTSRDQLDRFILGNFFESLGEIEESISIFSGILTEYEYGSLSYDLALRVQRCSVNEMIRKYILGMTMKLNGDPAALHCANKILEGLLLFGAVHIDIVCFFHCLKNYYCTKLHFHDLKETGLTRECVSMVDNIVEEWETIRTDCDSKTIQLPQVLLRTINGAIVMVDEVFEESPHEHKHEISVLLSSMKLRAKQKCFGDARVHTESSRSVRKFGIEWVNFWKNCYLDNNGELPRDLNLLFLSSPSTFH